MSQVSYLFHFGFLGPHYFLQEISDTTFSGRFWRIIGPSLLFSGGFPDPWEMLDLLQWNQHFWFDIISGLRPIVKIILENTEVKTQPLFLQKPIIINIFWIHFCNPKIAYHSYPQYKYFNNSKISKRYLSFSQNTEIELLQMIIDVIRALVGGGAGGAIAPPTIFDLLNRYQFLPQKF